MFLYFQALGAAIFGYIYRILFHLVPMKIPLVLRIILLESKDVDLNIAASYMQLYISCSKVQTKLQCFKSSTTVDKNNRAASVMPKNAKKQRSLMQISKMICFAITAK